MSRQPAIIAPGTLLPPLVAGDSPGRRPSGRPARRAATVGRFAMLNHFVDNEMACLTRAELAAWLVLYRDTYKDLATTAQSDIARRSGVQPRSVVRAIKALKSRGLISVVTMGTLASGPSSYRLARPP